MLYPLVGSVFPLEVNLFIERVLDIHHVNFSVVEQITICKQRCSNNAKFMLVLKFLKIHFSVKTNLQEGDINS